MKRSILLSAVLLIAVACLSSFGYSEDFGIPGKDGFGGPSNSVSGEEDSGRFCAEREGISPLERRWAMAGGLSDMARPTANDRSRTRRDEETARREEAPGVGPKGGVTEEWKRWYAARGTGDDAAVGVVVDASGNAYVTGTSKGRGTLSDIVTIKYDPQGKVLWTKRYNGTGKGTDEASAITLDALGNVYVTGSSFGGTKTGQDFITLKYDASGKLLWQKLYHGPGNGDDGARAIAVDASGNVYVTGSSFGGSSGKDYATVKCDASGKLLWEKRYNGPGNGDDGTTAIAVDAAGSVHVTGSSYGANSKNDYATVKYDASGKLIWQKRTNGAGSSEERSRSLALDSSGNIYVTGASDLGYLTVKLSQ